jgi:hypothetical protein
VKYGKSKTRDLLCSIMVEVHKRCLECYMCVSRVATCVSVAAPRVLSPETLLVSVTFKCIGCREYCVLRLNQFEMNKSPFP